ncbi:MAG: Rpn family recombination-promoting nuclease/putative transposase [Planktothrix sp.]|uniref:Rpn family recombination-promoting nuclease/putative transposase n=1 Tax=Planktothrix sp. TaxID=3088171 RepID=UPI0038D41F2E
MRFINPKTDFAFKKIFGSSESKDILISFLNALVYNSESVIQDLEIFDPYLSAKITGLKDTYLDVKAQLNTGEIVIIEMQVLNVEAFTKRVLYNAAKTYSLQLDAGQGYRFLKPVIALTITDFIEFKNTDEFISRFVFKEKIHNFNYSENDLELVFVELPKFQKSLEQLETLTDKWIYFMQSARLLESVPETLESVPQIQRAFQIANQTNLTREELDEVEKRELFLQDQINAITLAKQEGQAEGRTEKAVEIARQLLNILDDETISRTTGLSLEAIQRLRS